MTEKIILKTENGDVEMTYSQFQDWLKGKSFKVVQFTEVSQPLEKEERMCGFITRRDKNGNPVTYCGMLNCKEHKLDCQPLETDSEKKCGGCDAPEHSPLSCEDFYKKSQPSLNWEEELDEEFGVRINEKLKGVEYSMDYGDFFGVRDDLKSFIRNLLDSQKKELVREIEGMIKVELIEWEDSNKAARGDSFYRGGISALKDILLKIKK